MSEEKIIASINDTLGRIEASLDRQEVDIQEINDRVNKLINRGDDASPFAEQIQHQ